PRGLPTPPAAPPSRTASRRPTRSRETGRRERETRDPVPRRDRPRAVHLPTGFLPPTPAVWHTGPPLQLRAEPPPPRPAGRLLRRRAESLRPHRQWGRRDTAAASDRSESDGSCRIIPR